MFNETPTKLISRIGFKGTAVNPALISLHGGSFEITLTVLLSQFKKMKSTQHQK